MDGLVTEDILELLADTGHFILTVERQDHHKSAVEKDPFHDDVVTDQVFEKLLRSFWSICREV